MEFTAYQLIMLAVVLVVQSVGITTYISKIKNDLNVRVAILETSQKSIDEDLKEIKADVKELLRTMSNS